MIAKVNRFHGHNSLSTVYRKGQTVSLSHVSLKYIAIKSDKPHRLAIVVSRKVDKSAVVRNRIRRRIYELMRNKHPKLTQNVDIVISVHNRLLATMAASELDELIDQMLIKAGLIER
jgi:ribonuclease P protein component